MTTHHADPNHQPGTTTPPQTARAAFSPPRLHPWIRCPPRPCSTLEALQRPQTPQPLGMAVAVVCCSAHGDPVLAVAIAHLATAAAPVPATAPAADLNPPANPPAGPPASPPAPADDSARAQGSWSAVVAVCALFTVAIDRGAGPASMRSLIAVSASCSHLRPLVSPVNQLIQSRTRKRDEAPPHALHESSRFRS